MGAADTMKVPPWRHHWCWLVEWGYLSRHKMLPDTRWRTVSTTKSNTKQRHDSNRICTRVLGNGLRSLCLVHYHHHSGFRIWIGNRCSRSLECIFHVESNIYHLSFFANLAETRNRLHQFLMDHGAPKWTTAWMYVLSVPLNGDRGWLVCGCVVITY